MSDTRVLNLFLHFLSQPISKLPSEDKRQQTTARPQSWRCLHATGRPQNVTQGRVTHRKTSRVTLLAVIPTGTDQGRNTEAKGDDLPVAHGYSMTEAARVYRSYSSYIHQAPPFWLKGISEVFMVKKVLSNEQRTYRFYYSWLPVRTFCYITE